MRWNNSQLLDKHINEDLWLWLWFGCWWSALLLCVHTFVWGPLQWIRYDGIIRRECRSHHIGIIGSSLYSTLSSPPLLFLLLWLTTWTITVGMPVSQMNNQKILCASLRTIPKNRKFSSMFPVQSESRMVSPWLTVVPRAPVHLINKPANKGNNFELIHFTCGIIWTWLPDMP